MNISKREVLKRIGTLTSGSLASTGSVLAERSDQTTNGERSPIEQQYLTENELKVAVRTHADGLLRELVERNLFTSSSVGDLPLSQLDSDETHLPPDETKRKVAVTSVPMEEDRTALIMISENTPENAIGVYVQPEAEKAYAIVHPKANPSERYKIDYSSDEITVQDEYCEDKTECDTGDWCNGGCDTGCGYYWEIEYECYRCDDGTQTSPCCCDEVGTSCGNGCYCCYSDCPCN